jgi:hypothetical protein
MAKSHKQAVVADQGPPERRQHNTVAAELDVNNRVRLRVLDQLEIDRLLHKRLITLDEHISAEHFHKDLVGAGFIRSSNWALDGNVRGDTQSISTQRSDAMVKVGMATRWLHREIGRRDTDWLICICTDAIRVGDGELPRLKGSLKSYRDFEGAWHTYEGPMDLPSLLVEVKPITRRTVPTSIPFSTSPRA